MLVFFLYLCTCAPVVHISYSFYCESDLLQKVLSAATDLDYFIIASSCVLSFEEKIYLTG